MADRKRVIIAPLAWGLGHATRCMPVTDYLLKQGHELFVVLTKDQKALFFPVFGGKLKYIDLDEQPVHYRFGFAASMLLQSFRFYGQIKREKNLAAKLILELEPDLIISDNRYGFRSNKVKSVIICHQLNLQIGFLSRLGNRVHRCLLSNFSEIWVPDSPGSMRIGGLLSKPQSNLNLRYTGPLSRMENTPFSSRQFDLLAILSGPEPSRSKLEQLLIRYIVKSKISAAIIRGTLDQKSNSNDPHIEFVSLADPDTIADYASRSRAIVCRSGYSTLCDLAAMHRRALLIPTPGQGEQEYLASYFSQTFGFKTANQHPYHLLEQSLAEIRQADTSWDTAPQCNIHLSQIDSVLD